MRHHFAFWQAGVLSRQYSVLVNPGHCSSWTCTSTSNNERVRHTSNEDESFGTSTRSSDPIVIERLTNNYQGYCNIPYCATNSRQNNRIDSPLQLALLCPVLTSKRLSSVFVQGLGCGWTWGVLAAERLSPATPAILYSNYPLPASVKVPWAGRRHCPHFRSVGGRPAPPHP
jgi:hypothetical protein